MKVKELRSEVKKLQLISQDLEKLSKYYTLGIDSIARDSISNEAGLSQPIQSLIPNVKSRIDSLCERYDRAIDEIDIDVDEFKI